MDLRGVLIAGDTIGGDKVGGDKVGRDKVETQYVEAPRQSEIHFSFLWGLFEYKRTWPAIVLIAGILLGYLAYQQPAVRTLANRVFNNLKNLMEDEENVYPFIPEYLPTLIPTFSPTSLPSTPATPTPVSIGKPDLVVEDIHVSPEGMTFNIKNIGVSSVVTQAFWVDVYINPAPPPTNANQTWRGISSEGMVWGIDPISLPYNSELTLQINDQYFAPDQSVIPSTILTGSILYVQVDSANSEADYGAILEGHEERGENYNNISSIVVTHTITTTNWIVDTLPTATVTFTATPTSTLVPMTTSTPAAMSASDLQPILIRFDDPLGFTLDSDNSACLEYLNKAVQQAINNCGELNSNWVCYGNPSVEVITEDVQFQAVRVRERLPISVLTGVNIDETGILVMRLILPGKANPVNIVAFAQPSSLGMSVTDPDKNRISNTATPLTPPEATGRWGLAKILEQPSPEMCSVPLPLVVDNGGITGIITINGVPAIELQ